MVEVSGSVRLSYAMGASIFNSSFILLCKAPFTHSASWEPSGEVTSPESLSRSRVSKRPPAPHVVAEDRSQPVYVAMYGGFLLTCWMKTGHFWLKKQKGPPP